MPRVSASSFDALRAWNGEQSRAFEEVTFQLLKDTVPPGAQAIRTGNPDGGVEWYAVLPNCTEQGWQAKHVHGIDALLTAMTKSVDRVAKERPDLRKLTFVISWNLATGRRGGERKSQREKYEDKIKTWQDTIPGVDRIEFELVQESDLLDELVKPQHRGRRWFWWDNLVLGHDWLVTRYEEQVDAASEKYRPDLQVDLPIQDDLLALGFDGSVLGVFDRLVREVVSAVAELSFWTTAADKTTASLHQAIRDTAATLTVTSEALRVRAGDPPAVLEPMLAAVTACQEAIRAAEEHERKLEAAWHRLPDDDPKKAGKPSDQASSYRIRGLATAMYELRSWLGSSVGQSFRSPAYFLVGEAGSGKTHLLLDATRRALDADRPAVFLAGAQFGQGNLWASVTDQLGLEAVGADVLLQAMDAAGEAASTSGSRFVIFVDALNETTPPDFWRVHLPRLRAAIAPYPHVALAVSCRDTYEDLVLEGTERSRYLRRAHPGFAEREIEATHRYFAHYQLEAPKIPLLTPEFTLPLFLRLYCESLSRSEAGSFPDGHQGRIAIFERYLEAKTATVARRYRRAATSSYELAAAGKQVSRVLDGLLDALSALGRESMSTGAAEAAASAALSDPSADTTRILGLLQEEGVLTRERLYLGDGTYDEGVRIVFQAFADFLLLKRRLALSDNPTEDQAVKSWLVEECTWGIGEAATILFPEVYGVELPDLLGLTLGHSPEGSDDRDATDRNHRARRHYRTLVETLPYRDSRAISQRTIDLLNEAQPHLAREEFYRVLFTLAPQSDNRLNGDGLHHYLVQQPMPRRDSDFGFATYHELFQDVSPASRLARWAAAGPYPAYDAEVLELACVPLCWLLSSPNRFMRDWITKALVQLLRGHLDVMRALFERFWTVDDPYVVQRVVAIAHGSILRSTPAQAEQAKTLAEAVLARVFTRPIRPDELMLDAARGIVRWAVSHELLPEPALDSSHRPYGLRPPGPPPSEATLEAKYGWHEGQPDEESYSSLNFSLLSMGDFGRYVVESGLYHFSRYRIGKAYPRQEDCEPRLIKSRWQKFVASLSDDQKTELAAWLHDPEGQSTSRMDIMFMRAGSSLTHAQHELFDAVLVYPKPIDDEYPADGGRRWVFRRTLSLGWTPKLFGHEDRMLGHGGDRDGHKAERWGKKYQWMAYHELLARVADNFQVAQHYHDSEPYDGLHQIIGEREIDPSLPPIDFRAFTENHGNGVTAWERPVIRLAQWPPAPLGFSRYRGDVRRFLAETTSEPTVAGSLFLRDRDGNDWTVLKSYVQQVDPLAHRGRRGLQERSTVNTLLVTASDSAMFLAAMSDGPPHAIHDLVDSHGHTDCCHVGEIGRTGPKCHHRHDEMREVVLGSKHFRVVATVERYAWEGNILDCSIGETAIAVLPSTYLQRTAGLTFDMRGPSWLDTGGAPVFTYYEEPGNGSHALLVRSAFLREFLSERGLELVVLHDFERMQLGGDDDGEHPSVRSTVNARLTGELTVHERTLRRMERGLT